MMRSIPFAALILASLALRGRGAETPVEMVSYNFSVRPILANTCFKCHGPDEKARKGKLRLDNAADAYAKAITPGDVNGSEVWKRLISKDPEEIMPPPDAHLELMPADRAVLKTWIAQGAKYDTHWAFQPITAPAVPALKSPWVRCEIDAFVLEKLSAQQLQPASEADRGRWLKRVSMDLTGLPPSLAELDAFLKDASTTAFEGVVDRLLAAPQYGERMANDWLDAARYADTYGRHEDGDSENFPYRDWAIRVFNQNLPYDQFIEWQIAGDLIPNASVDQQLATAFNRLHPQSNESGSDEEEFRIENVADRVKTTATALLGLTLECAKCHDHKYDPLSAKDYYAFSAFLNNIDEQGLFSRFTNAVPTPAMFLYAGDEEAQHQELKQRIASQVQALQDLQPAARERFQKWLAAGGKPTAAKPTDHLNFETKIKEHAVDNIANAERPAKFMFKTESMASPVGKSLFLKGDTKITWEGAGDYHRSDPFSLSLWLKPQEALPRAVLIHHTVGSVDAANRGYELILDDMHPDFCLAHFWPGNGIRIRALEPLPVGKWSHLTAVYDGTSKAAGMHLYLNGLEVKCEVLGDHLTKDLRYEVNTGDLDERKVMDAGISKNVILEIGGRRNDSGLANAYVDEIKIFDRALTAAEAKVQAGLDASKDDWFLWYLREVDPPSTALAQELHNTLEAECEFTKKVREMMIMREHTGARRQTFVLTRGRFDVHGAEVQPDTPQSILPWPAGLKRDRAGLAKWFTHPQNPLTARVAVNRFWQIFFGRGLVSTPEDFGIQGALPSHPALLDWLAADFRSHGWDVKRLCRQIVLSATYRQSGVPQDAKLLVDDPDNSLLAHGPHHRWSAEQIRDQALAVSGLLVPTLGGPSVFPYQPANLWEDSGTQHSYKQDTGPGLYRRSMYSFWRRTLPPPTMTILDAPTREYCRVRRDRTSSPMQALALLNDPQMLECARVLAGKLLHAHPQDPAAQLRESFRQWTARPATEAELEVLGKYYTAEQTRFSTDAKAAAEFLANTGDSKPDATLPVPTLAALTMVQRMLLNAAETVIKY